MPTPRDQVIELIRKELDDAMRHSYSEGKIERIAPSRAEAAAAKIIKILREANK